MRFKALIQGHLWEMRRNPMMIMAPMMAILLTALWAVTFPRDPQMRLMAMAMGLAFCAFSVGWQLPSMTIAEEKEKRTLEALLLTPVRPAQILAAKLLITGVAGVITAVICMAIWAITPAAPGYLAVAFLLGLLFTMAGGTLMGLLCPDTKTLGLTSTFLMLGLFFAGLPMFAQASAKVWAAFAYLPGRPLFELMLYGVEGHGDNLVRNLAVLLAYTALAIFLCIRTMRRQAFRR